MAMQGAKRWAVVPVMYSDMPTQDRTNTFYETWFTSATRGNLRDYWNHVSSGKISLDGSAVFPWTKLSFPTTDARNVGPQVQSRWNRSQNILDDIKGKLNLTNFDYIALVVNAQFGSGASGECVYESSNGTRKAYPVVLLDNFAWTHTFLTHEMGHCFGFDHSFDQSPTTHSPGNDDRPGAYGDPFDIMSAMLVHTYADTTFGASGPTMNAVNRIQADWAPGSKYEWIPKSKRPFQEVYELRPLNQATGLGIQMLKFELHEEEMLFTVEFREASQFDAGIGKSVVLVHEIRAGKSVLWTGTRQQAGLDVGDEIRYGQMRLSVRSIEQTPARATIEIRVDRPSGGGSDWGGDSSGSGGGSGGVPRRPPMRVRDPRGLAQEDSDLIADLVLAYAAASLEQRSQIREMLRAELDRADQS